MHRSFKLHPPSPSRCRGFSSFSLPSLCFYTLSFICMRAQPSPPLVPLEMHKINISMKNTKQTNSSFSSIAHFDTFTSFFFFTPFFHLHSSIYLSIYALMFVCVYVWCMFCTHRLLCALAFFCLNATTQYNVIISV